MVYRFFSGVMPLEWNCVHCSQRDSGNLPVLILFSGWFNKMTLSRWVLAMIIGGDKDERG